MIQDQIVARGITDQKIIEIMGQVPRHEFVDDALKGQSYADAPLSIGSGQTISQPYIVALMSQALGLCGDENILELGTGSGYQTVVLALAARKVYTVERVKFLAMEARRRFKRFGFRNIVLRVSDGSSGWPEEAPFDRILVTCAAPSVPEHLISQMSEGGVMVVPVSVSEGYQNLMRIKKTRDSYTTEDLGGCHFVKLIGKFGYGG